jgi:hypothetical protein
MPIVQPPKQRYEIEHDGASLRITIPSCKNIFAMFVLGIWLIGWVFGAVMAGGTFVSMTFGLLSDSSDFSDFWAVASSGASLFILAWLGLWTLFGGFAAYKFLWQVAGREIIEVGPSSIRIKRAIFGIGRVKEYLAEHIIDLRVSPLSMINTFFGLSRMMNLWGNTDGLLAYDYGSKTFRFGGGAEEAEAKQILEAILARFPQYRVQKLEAG